MTKTLAQIHTGTVADSLAAPDRPCIVCSTPLHTVVIEHADEFGLADASGHYGGGSPDLAHWYDPAANLMGASSPEEALSCMQELLDTGYKAVPPGSEGKRASLTPLHREMARAYQFLNIRLGMGHGMDYHVHTVDSGFDHDAPRPPCRPDLPHHCGWPAWCRPSGWHCRRCRLVLDDATAEFPGRTGNAEHEVTRP